MKTLALLTVVGLLALVVGCEERGSTGTTVTNTTGGTLTLQAPAEMTIKRGEIANVMIDIKRENLEGPVSVRFDNLPAGVTAVDRKQIVGNQGEFNFKAADTADLVSNHQAKVTASGSGGIAATKPLTITVTNGE